MFKYLLLLLLPAIILSDEQKKKFDCPVIGIDLGTTYSCVGIFKNGRVEIIPNEQGSRITPSWVAFNDEERLVGEAAKNQYALNPERTFYDVKRLIGRNFRDKEVQHDKQHLPFNIVESNGKPKITAKVNGEEKGFYPEEISAMVLQKMKTVAETYLGESVKNAVITVPAYFNDFQRQSTKDAGQISGQTVARIINEPTAAAIAFGLDKGKGEMNTLVFDLGGGTFDVSILSIDNGIFEVISTSGDTHLGGEDFDQRVLDYMLKMFKKKYNKDASGDKRALAKLKREIEKGKRALSSTTETRIEVENFFDGEDFSETFTRAKFEDLCSDLFKKTMGPVQVALEDAGQKKEDIHELVLVGGSTRIPKVQELLKKFFNGKEPNAGINPDEAVAYGAAVQGDVLCGGDGSTRMVIIDLTPLTMGIETIGGVMSTIVPRGTTIPVKKTESYTTTTDNQTTLDVSVYEGERPLTKDNHLLGKFDLKGIKPAPRGTPQIEVTFAIDENSIQQVTAVDKGSNVTESITIANDKGRLSQSEIEKMIEDAEKFAEDDNAAKKQIDARNNFDSYVNSITQTLNNSKEELEKKLSEEEMKSLKVAIKEAEDWIHDNSSASKEEFEQRQKDLESLASPLIGKFYGKKNQKDDDEEENPYDL